MGTRFEARLLRSSRMFVAGRSRPTTARGYPRSVYAQVPRLSRGPEMGRKESRASSDLWLRNVVRGPRGGRTRNLIAAFTFRCSVAPGFFLQCSCSAWPSRENSFGRRGRRRLTGVPRSIFFRPLKRSRTRSGPRLPRKEQNRRKVGAFVLRPMNGVVLWARVGRLWQRHCTCVQIGLALWSILIVIQWVSTGQSSVTAVRPSTPGRALLSAS